MIPFGTSTKREISHYEFVNFIHINFYSAALARKARAQRSTMGKKIW